MGKDIGESLVMVLDKFKQISDDYSDVKDLIVNDYNMELAEDSFKTLKMIHNTGKIFDMIKFRHFINGLNRNEITEEDLSKLIKYLDNKEKVEFVSNTFKKIINSNSKICCYIMGLIFNEIVNKNRQINQIDIAIINALGNLNDFDVLNFKNLMTVHYNYVKKSKFISISTVEKKHAKELDISFAELSLTTEICAYSQIFFKRAEADLSIDEDDVSSSVLEYDEYYEITIIGEKLYQLILEIDLRILD